MIVDPLLVKQGKRGREMGFGGEGAERNEKGVGGERRTFLPVPTRLPLMAADEVPRRHGYWRQRSPALPSFAKPMP